MANDTPDNPPDVEALFPEGSSPENRVPKVSALCSYGTRPHGMTGFLRQLLISHFADPDNIEDEKIRQRLNEMGAWRPSENGEFRTGILIESLSKWQPADSDKRPAILISRQRWQWERQTIGDSDGETYRDGALHFYGMWSGSHVLFALAERGSEAEILATEVSRFCLHYGPVIVDQMNLHRFVPVGVDTLHELKEVAEGYAVPVAVAYMAEESWKLQPYAPRLKRIVFRASDLFC